MTLLALAAPTVNVIDPQFTVASGAIPAATETALTGNTGFTVPWVPGLCVHIVAGATAPGVVTLVSPNSGPASPPNLTLTMAASASLLYLIPYEFVNLATGLIQINVTTVTTASAGAYIMPAATGKAHNPFEINLQAADY